MCRDCEGVGIVPVRSKVMSFLGDTHRTLQELPEGARRRLGFALRIVQMGSRPDDVRALSGFPVQVLEIRVREDKEAIGMEAERKT